MRTSPQVPASTTLAKRTFLAVRRTASLPRWRKIETGLFISLDVPSTDSAGESGRTVPDDGDLQGGRLPRRAAGGGERGESEKRDSPVQAEHRTAGPSQPGSVHHSRADELLQDQDRGMSGQCYGARSFLNPTSPGRLEVRSTAASVLVAAHRLDHRPARLLA